MEPYPHSQPDQPQASTGPSEWEPPIVNPLDTLAAATQESNTFFVAKQANTQYAVQAQGFEPRDLVIIAFLNVAERKSTEEIAALSNVGAFLRRGIRNAAIDTARMQMRQPETESDTDRTALETMLSEDSGFEEEIAEQQRVRDAIMQLPTQQRKAIVLRYYYDLSGQEIADRLGISYETVNVYVTRAKKVLAVLLASSG
jgi:RNA polymerase sigma factor (sigma-70 family)